MNDTQVKTVLNVSLRYLILASVSVVLMISGFLGHGIIFKIAVSGPWIVSTLGLFLLIFTVEARHNLSQVVDSKLTSFRGLETSFKEIRWKLELTLFLFGTIFFLGATSFLSNRSYTGFVLFLMSSSAMIAILTGRYFGSSISQNATTPLWAELNQYAKNREYQQLKEWLDGDASENLSAIQEQKIEQQKNLFLEKIKLELSTDLRSKATISSLRESDEIIEMLFTYSLKNTYNEWLIDILNIQKKTNDSMVRNSLVSLLLFPTIIHLMSELSKPKSGGHYDVFNRLLTGAGNFSKHLNSIDRFIDGDSGVSDSVGVSKTSIDLNIQKFIQFIALKTSMYPHYEFSPWWLLSIRMNLLKVNDFEQWGEEKLSARLYHILPVVHNQIDDWCYLLSEYFEGNEITTLSADASWGEQTQWVSKAMEKIDEQQSGTFDLDLLKLTWSSFLKLN